LKIYGENLTVLEKAKEITNKETDLRKQKEISNTTDLINV